MELFSRQLIDAVLERRDIQQKLTNPKDETVVLYPDDSLASISPVTANEALKLIDAGLVVGVASKHGYLLRLRLVASVQAARRVIGRNRTRPSDLPIAEDNKTTFLDGATYFHHRARSAAYAPSSA